MSPAVSRTLVDEIIKVLEQAQNEGERPLSLPEIIDRVRLVQPTANAGSIRALLSRMAAAPVVTRQVERARGERGRYVLGRPRSIDRHDLDAFSGPLTAIFRDLLATVEQDPLPSYLDGTEEIDHSAPVALIDAVFSPRFRIEPPGHALWSFTQKFGKINSFQILLEELPDNAELAATEMFGTSNRTGMVNVQRASTVIEIARILTEQSATTDLAYPLNTKEDFARLFNGPEPRVDRYEKYLALERTLIEVDGFSVPSFRLFFDLMGLRINKPDYAVMRWVRFILAELGAQPSAPKVGLLLDQISNELGEDPRVIDYLAWDAAFHRRVVQPEFALKIGEEVDLNRWGRQREPGRWHGYIRGFDEGRPHAIVEWTATDSERRERRDGRGQIEFPYFTIEPIVDLTRCTHDESIHPSHHGFG